MAKFNLEGYCSEEDDDGGGGDWGFKLMILTSHWGEVKCVQKAMVSLALADQKQHNEEFDINEMEPLSEATSNKFILKKASMGISSKPSDREYIHIKNNLAHNVEKLKAQVKRFRVKLQG